MMNLDNDKVYEKIMLTSDVYWWASLDNEWGYILLFEMWQFLELKYTLNQLYQCIEKDDWMKSMDSYRSYTTLFADIIFWSQSLIERTRWKTDFQNMANNLDSFFKTMGKE